VKAVIIIPARYASSRLPAKMLLMADGKPLLQHTYERALKAERASRVIIAADDERILAAARRFGAQAVMTDPKHNSGSSRAAEAARGLEADVVVNVQGDEPELDPAALDLLIALQAAEQPFASTLACPFPATVRLDDPSAVKAILGRRVSDGTHEALYFTRALAPFARDGAPMRANYHLHVGVYAFRPDALQLFAAAPEGRLERIEKLEQLRILEMGERILVRLVDKATPGIDTPEDFAAFKARVEDAP
jgi:3-deoxy-manno-octulosonate cytidylyltransferase (CMP-KDO synthetase)